MAKYLSVSEKYVRRRVLERRIPFHKVGAYVKFKPEEIYAWLDSGEAAD